MGSPESPESLLVEAGNSKLASQRSVIEQLENKSSVLLGFSLVSIVEVLGFLLLVASEHAQAATSEPCWVHSTFYLALVSVVIASGAGIFAMRGNSSHSFHASAFPDYRKKNNLNELKAEMLESIEGSIRRNHEVIGKKRAALGVAMVAIGVALVLYSILVARLFCSRF